MKGASAPANVLAAITEAESLFGTYTPVEAEAMKGSNETRQAFIRVAGVLGYYNEGYIGPGHCR
jgi:hypothetical protein